MSGPEIDYFRQFVAGDGQPAMYFANELLLMLERAGFAEVAVRGGHNDAEPTADDDFLVFIARK